MSSNHSVEVRLSCPYWMSCLIEACNAPGDGQSDNAMALSSAVAARCRNQLMSAVAYRISAILFHSGVKHQDIRRLHKLGVCMSPEMIIEMERKMGESCERKLLLWKREIKENKSAKLLLKYKMFGEDSYKRCKTLVSHIKQDLSCVYKEDLKSAIQLQHQKKLPSYK